jgi:hypothetical protein
LQIKIRVGVQGMPWASQSNGLNHSWMNLGLFAFIPCEKLHDKKFSHFLCVVISGIR